MNSDGITYPFLNFNGSTIEVWECISNTKSHPTLYWACDYLSMLGLKLNHVSKRGHWYTDNFTANISNQHSWKLAGTVGPTKHAKKTLFNPSSKVNSLAPGKFEWNFKQVIFKRILVIDDWGISCEIALIWMSLDFTDDQSTLVQVMAWCHQATSHYLSQCWPRSLSPCMVSLGHKWVN